MKIGEVGLLTNDVPRLAVFYRRLLEVENGIDDATHQFILSNVAYFRSFSKND